MSDAPKKIIVAEDESALRELYVAVLGIAGYEVVGAADGEEAYSTLKKQIPDLLLLDILMPKLNGIELLQRLSDENIIHSIPRIVMLTNLTDDSKIAQTVTFGIRGYMIKSSYTPDTLIAEVAKYLGQG
jgi:CheY-like chemotaxis protein